MKTFYDLFEHMYKTPRLGQSLTSCMTQSLQVISRDFSTLVGSIIFYAKIKIHTFAEFSLFGSGFSVEAVAVVFEDLPSKKKRMSSSS
jgi:hypothetical protein